MHRRKILTVVQTTFLLVLVARVALSLLQPTFQLFASISLLPEVILPRLRQPLTRPSASTTSG